MMKDTPLHLRYRVVDGRKFRLADADPDDVAVVKDKKEAAGLVAEDRKDLIRLQELMYAEAKHALLVVFQAMDTGGKDGCIENVMQGINPQGCRVTSFRAPTADELAHDFLWRVHQAAPARRMVGVFNRSHYEDVLVVRVHHLVPRSVWGRRYEQINAFERLLTHSGVTILKFFLHISKDEQKRRLQARLDDPAKQWKFSVGDLEERALWQQYMQAYEDAVRKTSTLWAPWYVVPANHKWYRDLVVGRVIREALRGFQMDWPEPADDLSNVVIPD
jgi:PPK2 family polyphosphate:nucleotide phosphotransferase